MRSNQRISKNAFKPWTVDDLWLVHTNNDKSMKYLTETLSRSKMAIYNSQLVLKRTLNESSVDDAKATLVACKYGSKTIESFLEIWRRVNLTDYKVTPQVNITQTNDLDKLLSKLEEQFEGLKNAMIQVVEVAVELKTKEYREATEQELKDLRQLAEVAKGTNLGSVLKKKLMGAW